MKRKKSFSVVHSTVVRNTLNNVRAYLENEHHNVSAESFSGHEGFIAEIMTNDNQYILKALLNGTKNEIYIQVSLMYKITEKHKADVLRLINDTFCSTIIGRVNIENNLVTSQADINLETYLRQLRDFSGLSGVTAELYREAAPMFAPDTKLFKTIERVLVMNLMRVEDDVELLCDGMTYEQLKERNRGDDGDSASAIGDLSEMELPLGLLDDLFGIDDDDDGDENGECGSGESSEPADGIDHYETIDLGDGKTLTVPVSGHSSGGDDDDDGEDTSGLIGKVIDIIGQLADSAEDGEDGGSDTEDSCDCGDSAGSGEDGDAAENADSGDTEGETA